MGGNDGSTNLDPIHQRPAIESATQFTATFYRCRYALHKSKEHNGIVSKSPIHQPCHRTKMAVSTRCNRQPPSHHKGNIVLFATCECRSRRCSRLIRLPQVEVRSRQRLLRP